MLLKIKKRVLKSLNKLKLSFLSSKQKEAMFYEEMFVKNNYWNSSKPNEEEVLRWEIIKSYLNLINKEFPHKDMTILDLGCGRGWLTNLMSNYGKITGIEPVEAVVKHAKKLYPDINFLCGTSDNLLNKNTFDKYDLIVSSEVIEHIKDIDKINFIKNISNLTNESGYLILTTPRKEIQEKWLKFMEPGQPIEDWISEEELEKLVTDIGFTKVRVERFSIPPVKGAPKLEVYQLWLFKKND